MEKNVNKLLPSQSHNSIIPESFGEVNDSLTPIEPVPRGREQPGSFALPTLSSVPDPLPIGPSPSYNLFEGQIQISPPLAQDLDAETLADPIIGTPRLQLQPLFIPNDPLFDRQWHLQNTGPAVPAIDANVTPAWDLATGQGVTIAIVDDGLEYTHPDLSDRYLEEYSWDFNEGDADPAPFSVEILHDTEQQEIRDDDWTDFFLSTQLKGEVNHVQLELYFEHHSPDELEFFLSSPQDNEWELEDISGSGTYSLDTTFFNGEDTEGKWSLIIVDNVEGNQGFLNSWSLTIETSGAHGTAVAGVAAASGNNNLGVSGVAPDANLAALRLTADAVEDSQIADALYSDDRNQQVQIYNNSWKPLVLWAGSASLEALEQGITNGRSGQGTIYVFGAGNDWFEAQDYRENLNFNALASSRYTIAVGAIDDTGKKAWYSQEGAPLFISAPSGGNRNDSLGLTTTDLLGSDGRNEDGTGDEIYGANYDNLDYTNNFDGTSAATPVVSGVIALMLEVNPNLSWRDVQHILAQTANRDRINDEDANWSGKSGDAIRHSHKYGFGIVDAAAAVNAAADWSPVAPEVSISTEEMPGKRIPDNKKRGAKRSVVISQDITIESVEVELDIDHEFRGDLEIVLIAPDKTESILANTLDDAREDYKWKFTTVRHWGTSSQGEWTLEVRDMYPGYTGTWNSWKLNIHGTKPTVSVEATTPDASEDGNLGELTFTRTGNTDNPLIVNYSESGTAAAGADYEALTGIVEIPAGSDSATVSIDPIDDDEVEESETVEVVLNADGGYNIGTESSATVTIADNDFVLPVANNDFAIAITGKSVTIPVLESDSDPNGDTLSITGVSTPNLGNASIFDNGTADSSDDQIIYTGTTAGVTDTFTYTITDGNGNTSTATVSVGVFADAAGTARTITGDANNNVLVGSDGIAVNEQLNGGSGDDILIGRGGGDLLTGNAGADEFRFLAAADSGTNGIDLISDFDPSEGDTIGLAFKANSTGVSVTSLGSGFFNLTISGTSFNLTIQTDPVISDTNSILNAIEYGSPTLPVANNDFAIAITGTPVAIPVLDSDSDPNGDTLSITGVSTPINGNASIFDNGTTGDSSDDQIIYTGTTAGVTDTFTYTITDGNGNTDTATVTVEVFANDASVDAVNDTVSVVQALTNTIAVLTNDSDSDGGTLSITGVSTATNGTVTISDNGTTVSTDDVVLYTPTFTGTDSFTYTITDGQGSTDWATVSVTVEANAGPTAVNDSISLATTTTIPVLDNDTDPNAGDSLSVTGVGSQTNQAAAGTVALTGGQVIYTPVEAAATGATSIADSFIYTITDIAGGTSTASVSVTVGGPQPPVANNDSVTIVQGTTQTLSAGLTANDSDPNGDHFSIVGVSTPTNGGTANVTGGQVIYTAPDSATTDTFTYSIADGTGTDSATVTMSVISGSTLPAGVIHTALYNGHTYHLLDTDGTKWWQDAEAQANILGGHLVTINDAAENQWVLDTFGPIALTYANDNNLPDRDVISLWVGLNDHLNEGTYQWSSGQSNEYRNWDVDQPQDFFDDEDFAGISVNFGTPGKWHDIVGDTRLTNLPFGVVEVENDSPPTQENGFLLVSSFLSDEVLRYDATTGEFIDEFISAGSGGLDGPDGLALGPDGNLYVSSQLTDQVLRYDGTTGAFIDVFASGGGLDAPIEITFGPDDNLYVSSAGTDQVLRYDGTTGAFIDVFASGGGLDGPIEITFGPDGNLYVSSFVADQAFQILRYNGTTGAFLDVFISGEGLTGINRGLTFGPDDNLYLTSSLSDYVLRYDGTTGEFIDEFVPAGSGGLDFPHDVTFGPDGNVYVSSALTDSVLRYDDTTGAFLDVFASGGGLDGAIDLVFVDNSPPPTQENDFFLVSSFNTDQVLRYDATTGEFIDVFASGGGLNNPDDLTFGPDGNLYVGSFGTDQVLRYDGTTGAFIDVFASGGGLNDPGVITFGPDGNLYVGSFGTDQVLRYDGTTGAFLDVFASGGGLDGPSGIFFGPDGNLYVNSLNTHKVLRYDSTTGVFQDVFASGGGLHAPNRGVAFGPDGNLYVTSSLSDEVLRYDGTTGLFIDEFVPAGSGGLDFPNDLTFGPEGNLYVSSVVTKSVLRYDGTTGAFLDVFASDGGLSGPVGLAFTPSEPAEPFPHSQKILAQDAASDSYFGRSLALDGDRLIVGSNGSQDNGDFSGAAYLMNISTGQQTKKLIAPDAFHHDNFGWSVAVDGDYALVGAFGSNDKGESSGSAYLFDATNGNYIREFIASDGSNLDNFGFSVAIDGNHALIGSRWDSDLGTYSGSAYLFDVTTGQQLHKFTAPDGATRDEFGWSVALHDNYALIGSRHDDDKGEDSGSAYLFDITTGEQLHKFTAEDGASEDFFGYSVALNGETALIGAYGDDDKGAYTGAAYQFDVITGQQLRKITAPDGESWDWFGYAVAIDENSNLAVISSQLDDDKGNSSGAAYLFDLDSGALQKKIVPSDGTQGDRLGESVAISGNAVVIGTIHENDFGNNSGAVYLYSQTEPIAEFNNPTPPDPSADHEPVEPYPLSPKIIAPDGETNELFGYAVAIEGNKALIGAYQDDDLGTNGGSAYLMDLNTGEQLHKFLASDGNSYRNFGYAVAMESNYALIGSYGDTENGENSGAAYLFDTNTGQQLRKFIAPDGASLDQFGWSVALDGNYALIGSKWDEDKGPHSGSAYLFDITTGNFLRKFIAPDGVTDAQFGWSVALAGDNALIGAIWDDDQGEKSGSAYLFDITTGNLKKKYIAPDGAASEIFGNAVAMNGNYALIGSRGDSDNGSYSGSAYLFDITTGTQLHKFIAPDGESGDVFGHSVALNGNHVAIGASGDNDNGENSGSTYLFDINGNFLNKIVPDDGEIEDNFGNSVAISGNSVLIGAYLDDVRGSDSGSAYLYPIE